MYDAKVWYKVSSVRFDFVSSSMNFIFSIYFIFHFCFNKIFLGALYQSFFPCKMYRRSTIFFYKNISKKLKENDSLIGNFQIVEVPLTAWRVTSTC